MQERLKQILEESKEQLKNAVSLQDAEDVRVKVLGKKGQLTEILRGMGKLTPEERKELGQAANQVRAEIEAHLEETFAHLKEKAQQVKKQIDKVHIQHQRAVNRFAGDDVIGIGTVVNLPDFPCVPSG